jgi:signal transduction histidine kinase/ligand-binding sensor domain-containing protein/DNA-binding response OmpR family regulator
MRLSRKNIGVYLSFLIIQIFGVSLFSQVTPPITPTKIRHISSSDGLSQVSINALVKDKDGFTWIGTQDGLNRFDGSNIIQFRYEENNPNSLCGNFINTLFIDDKERIWIGTDNRGFCYYDTQKGIFVKPNLNKKYTSVINSGIVTDIDQDSSGAIWINTMNYGLLKLNASTTNSFTGDFISIDNGKFTTTTLHITEDQNIWIGTETGTIFNARLNDGLNKPNLLVVANNLINGTVNCFITDDQNIWIGTDEGLWSLSKRTKVLSFFDLNTITTKKTSRYRIYDLAFSLNDELWVASDSGLYRLQNKNKNGKFTKVSIYKKGKDNIISHNTIYSILPDLNTLWVGTSNKLDIFSFKKPEFNNITTQSNHKLNNSIVFSIYKQMNNLWIGTTGGLNLIANDSIYYFEEKSSNPFSISNNIIRSIIPDAKDNLWIATKKGISIIDLNRFNPNKPIFNCIHSNSNNANSLSDDNTRDILIDSKKQVWITTNGKGVNRFTGDIRKNKITFQQFKHDPNNTNTISSNLVHCIKEDAKGNMWIGTQFGLDRITFTSNDYTHFKVKRFKSNPLNPNSISGNAINSIFFDKNGIMWIGTRYGLNKYHEKNETFSSFHLSDGLPNEVINSIQEDESNNLWLGTNKGLVCFNKNNEKITTLYVNDGIADNEFNSLASYIDSKGKMYFGGIKGLTTFYPPDILAKQKPVDVIISEIYKSESRNTKSNNFNIRKRLHFASHADKPIALRYNDFPLYIKYASPEYGPFNKPEYYYKLDYTNHEWNYLGDRNEIQFLNLSSGSHSLLLAGGQNGEVWHNKAYELQLKISPPWWKSVWAYLIYSLLFLSLIYTFYLFSLRRKLAFQENKRLIELDELKTKLFNNITHELRTPLTVIMGMTESIIDGMTKEQLKRFQTKFDILSKNNKKLLFLINQMLDLSKIESGNMQLNLVQDDIIPYIRVNLDSFHSLANKKNIDLIYYDEINRIIMDFDPEKITIIISNLISNAIKFTDEKGKIILHVNNVFHNNTPYLSLKIKDNGIGISEEDKKHIFDRFYQADTHSLSDGTGIGLSLTKEVVELMNGSICVESNLQKGTEFIVEIPITNKAEILSVTPKPEKITLIANDTLTTYKDVNYKDDLPLILIVEDNSDVAHFIASCLDKEYNIIFAKDGQEGIDVTFKQIPDIVITDLMMPNVNGLELTKALKEDERSSHIPIIILTARSLEKDRFKGLKHGADAYLTKPFNKKELIIRIEQLILLRKKLQISYSSYVSDKNIDDKKNDREAIFLKKVIKIIEKDISNSQLNAHSIAVNIAMSESQLYRKLKAISGKSTAIFIRSIRLLKAKKLLETTDMNISEVAYDCGFNEPTWFSKSFKEEYGVSPSTFRK